MNYLIKAKVKQMYIQGCAIGLFVSLSRAFSSTLSLSASRLVNKQLESFCNALTSATIRNDYKKTINLFFQIRRKLFNGLIADFLFKYEIINIEN